MRPNVCPRVQRRARRHGGDHHWLENAPRCGRGCIACVGCTGWLDEQKMGLLLGYGAVLRAFWDDEQLSWAKRDVTLTHANGDTTFEN